MVWKKSPHRYRFWWKMSTKTNMTTNKSFKGEGFYNLPLVFLQKFRAEAFLLYNGGMPGRTNSPYGIPDTKTNYVSY